MTTPKGYNEIVNLFGNPINKDKTLNKTWERNNIISVAVPIPFKMTYNGQLVTHIKIHQKLKSILTETLQDLWNTARIQVKKTKGYTLTTSEYNKFTQDLLDKIGMSIFSGSYSFRIKRGSTHISTHAFGIAIDLNAAQNPMGGSKTTFPAWAVKVWTKHGWTWGKTFNDPMHFQFASGY